MSKNAGIQLAPKRLSPFFLQKHPKIAQEVQMNSFYFFLLLNVGSLP
jgi:hypothetical protein